jgi:hypothetical protein
LASEAKSKLSGTGEPVDETIQAARDASRHGRFEFMQRNWSPAARVFAGALGGGMLLYGMKSRGRISKPMSALGVGLLTRGITNREFTSMPAAVRSMVGL